MSPTLRAWMAGVLLLTAAGAAQAQGVAVPARPAPGDRAAGSGFRPATPNATPGQTLVPTPQHNRDGVIHPPATIDRTIARPTPPAAAFPTPVVKPPQPPS